MSQGISPQTAAVDAPPRDARHGVRKASSEATDWDSFGYDLQRTGYNPAESTVGVSNVASLQKLWSLNVGFGMVHEPVLATNVYVGSQATNILYTGSANGAAMYAINANTGAVLWTHAVPKVNYYCFHQRLQFSIGETPAIDRGKNLLYFADGQNQVHAVDLATGTEANGWPVKVAHYRGDRNFMHGGLTYNPANGMLYAVTGSTCDITPWYGRIVAISTTGPSIAGTFYPISGTSKHGLSGGGIWGPGGASIDPNTNNVFVATGNADASQGQAQNAGYAEQIIELSPTLGTIVASNYPPNIPFVSGEDDFDFGATPLLFQPYGCPLMLAAVNKSGMFELYDVGSIDYGPIQDIAMSIPTDKGDFVGVPAFDPVTGYVYVGMPATQGIYKPGLAAFSTRSSNCTLNPTPVWAARFGPDGAHVRVQTPRSPLSIANGVVYVANYVHQTEFAFNAATGAQLWSEALPDVGDV
ncbi:MAG TPA: PQQ-binding-like beta-propeller repeat protein, partial [Candidatus Cybelea sp.]|nr:PQQ-binding-like beta-propeller repeat protein [Candidatus Cybelea sp.]